jgi:hypothetical protein
MLVLDKMLVFFNMKMVFPTVALPDIGEHDLNKFEYVRKLL